MKAAKRFIAFLQVVCLLIAALPVMNVSKPEVVNAAVSGIENGATYKIVSAYNGKAITQTDVSNYYADCVVWNTDAMSDLARWKVEESGDYYTIKNVVTGKAIKTYGNNSGDKLDLNSDDGADRYKWKLVPITSGQYAGCFFLVSAVKNDYGEEEYAEIHPDMADADGAQVRLWTKVTSIDYEPRQIWRFERSDAEYTGFTEEMNDTMLNAFKNQYYNIDADTGIMTLETDDDFWGLAEMMEALLDGYETTGKAVYRDMFVTIYDHFIAVNGEDWAWKDWNDDIAWAAIASARAYLLFGTEKYLTLGKQNFDMMFERANNRSDGMLIWKMNHSNDDTTSCINGPAIVAACYLAKATGDDSYYTKAKNLYSAWRNSTMYEKEGDEIGHVWDTMWEYWCSTYNQGTFIGSAMMLYERFGDESYYEDARNAVNHALRDLCYNNILIKEDTNTTDNSKMRGILMRYLRKFIVDYNNDEYLSFFKDNAKIAWMNRNSNNIQQCPWNKKTSEDVTWYSHAAYNSISLMANMPTYADTIVRDPYSGIEAEDIDYCRKLISEDSTGTSGGRSLGGIKNDCYSAYYNIDFGDVGASKVTFRYSRTPEMEGAKGKIELRLGSKDGTLIGTAMLDNTASWSDWQEVTVDITNTTGLQNLYLVYSSESEHVCNLDYISFTEGVEAEDSIKVEGYQISTAIGGKRVIGSVEPVINGQKVTKWGFVYGLASANGIDFGLTDEDMLVSNVGTYVKAYDSTDAGTIDTKLGDSDTATYFVRTMTFGEFSVAAYTAQYKVRAYAVLEDGTYVYSNVRDYSVYEIADYLYKGVLMNTLENHTYLYNNILKAVDPTYKEVDYNWGNVVVKPDYK